MNFLNTHHWADGRVVELDPGLNHLGDEAVLPPALLPGALGPTADLPLVVRAATALEKSSGIW